MIPSMLLLGLVIGLAPRPWFYLLSLLAGVGWAVLLVVNGTVDSGRGLEVFNAFMFGSVNAMIGATITRILVPIISNSIRGRR